jgi:hypothetical protein
MMSLFILTAVWSTSVHSMGKIRNFSMLKQVVGAGIAQSVQRRAGRPGFESWRWQEIYLHSFETGCTAHPAPYPMGTDVVSAGRGVKLTIHLHLLHL